MISGEETLQLRQSLKGLSCRPSADSTPHAGATSPPSRGIWEVHVHVSYRELPVWGRTGKSGREGQEVKYVCP